MPGIGREVNGARRWLDLPFVSVQPSELVKLGAVLYAADYTARKHAVMKSFQERAAADARGHAARVVAPAARARLRGAGVNAFSAFGILFLGGMNGRHFMAFSACSPPASWC
jgi:cell division protein FtsW